MSDAGRGRSGQALTSARGGRGGPGGFRGRAAASAVVALAMLPVIPTAAASVAPLEPAERLRVAAAVDVIRGHEWWLSALHVTAAWKLSKGRGVTVAVLDTGVDGRHPDLTGQVLTGQDYTGGVRRPGSKYWGHHGSAMASIIAGHGHGTGLSAGVLGIAPQAKILSIRVTWENDDPMRESGAQADSNRDAVASGIRYAVDHGAGVINMSLGGGKLFYNGNPTEEDAIRYALSKGAVLIASAGNDGAGANRKNFPAAYPGVIAVGAVDRDLRPWTDSNRHSYVKVAAPGVDIVSADAGGSYVLGTGTSPSSAIVAGIAALIRARYPKLTSVQVAEAMEKGVVRDSPAGHSSAVGAGVTDAARALSAANAINKTAYAGKSVRAPLPDPQTVPGTDEGGPNRLVIGFIAGVLGFLIIGLVRARRRRRRQAEEYGDYGDDDYDGGEDAEPWYGEGQARRPAGAGLTAAPQPGNATSPRPGNAAPVNVPPWQSTEALASPPASAENTGRQVWPPPQQPQVPPKTAAAPGDTHGIGHGHDTGGVRGGGDFGGGGGGLDRFDSAAPEPFEPPAPSPRPRNRGKGRVNEFRLDFGADPHEASASPDDRRTSGFRAVSPDDQQTTAFRAVSQVPDDQPTAGYRTVSPDDQRTTAFRVVPPMPDDQPASGYRTVSPDDQRTTAFRAVPPMPDDRPAGGGRSGPGGPGGSGGRGGPRGPDDQRTAAFRAVPPPSDQRPATGPQGGGPPAPDGRQHGGGPVPPTGRQPVGPHGGGPHGSGPHSSGPHGGGPHSSGPHSSGPHGGGPRGGGPVPPEGRQPGGPQSDGPPPRDERQAAALRAALADKYRRGEITRDDFYAGLAELRGDRW